MWKVSGYTTTSAANVDSGMQPVEVHDDEVEVNTERIIFEDEYAKCIKPIMANKLESMFARYMCSGQQIATHPFVCNDDEEYLLAILRQISLLIGDHLKIEARNIKKHSEI